MECIELQLDEQTLERARRLAAARHCSLEKLLKEMLEQMEATETPQDRILGMFAQEPELIDQVTELAMRARQEHPLREVSG